MNSGGAGFPAHEDIHRMIRLELEAARKIRKRGEDRREATRLAALVEEENIKAAERDGTILECGCCFGDYPLNRMVHCDNESSSHWFCRQCAKSTAEVEIGNAKYIVGCMHMGGCSGSFSMDQKTQFLEQSAIVALERNEQRAMLRMAFPDGLLESCAFCSYSAEYPPMSENKEFRCESDDCKRITCRLCRKETHIPMSCEEAAKENGLSARRQIEEAMSAALIRKCNKCRTPFIKLEGCNKMTCSASGCSNIQCYVCSKSCGYEHFNDSSRGGKTGNCPLFEDAEVRHKNEVALAEKEALSKVQAEHPEFTAEDLAIKVSDAVQKDQDRKTTADDARMNAFLARRR
jgi:TRIAD3 protein (E3 ubiquitin-protein ligase RNF216)